MAAQWQAYRSSARSAPHRQFALIANAEQTLAEHREAAVAGRLVEHRITLHDVGEHLGVGLFPDLERVEAGAQHEQELIAQHLTGGAQLAAIAELLAQD